MTNTFTSTGTEECTAWQSMCRRHGRFRTEADPQADVADFLRMESQGGRVDAAVLIHAHMHDDSYRARVEQTNAAAAELIQQLATSAGMRPLGARSSPVAHGERRGTAGARPTGLPIPRFDSPPPRPEAVSIPPSTQTADIASFMAARGVNRCLVAATVAHISANYECAIHVGTLTAHGPAPFEHDPLNAHSYYVMLSSPNDEPLMLWGLDLKRALAEAGVSVGNDVLLAYQGRRRVSKQVSTYDTKGAVTGEREVVAHRPTWLAVSVNHLLAATASLSASETVG